MATLKRAESLMKSVHPNLQLSEGFFDQTVKGIVKSIMDFKGFLAWESPPDRVIENIVTECVTVLEDTIKVSVGEAAEKDRRDAVSRPAAAALERKERKLKDIVDEIKDEFGIENDKMHDALNEAIDIAGFDQSMKELKLKAKALAIVDALSIQ